MSQYEWNAGCCPHDHFTVDGNVRTCLDCGEWEEMEEPSGRTYFE